MPLHLFCGYDFTHYLTILQVYALAFYYLSILMPPSNESSGHLTFIEEKFPQFSSYI